MLAAAPAPVNYQLFRNVNAAGQRIYKGQTAQVARYAAGYGEYHPPVVQGSWRSTRGTNVAPRVATRRGVTHLQGLGCSCDATKKQALGALDLSTDGPRLFMYGLGAVLILGALKRGKL